MSRLSVIIITYNEEENIKHCLESVQWSDEIVIIDSFSSDKTVEIAREFTPKVFQNDWTNFSQQKNLALGKATSEWVLNIDADERVTPELKEEILTVLNSQPQSFNGYYIARRNHYLGKWIRHCGWYPDYKLRLFRRGKGKFNERTVHESVLVEGRKGYLKSCLHHYSYKNLSDHLNKINKFTSLAAEEMFKNGKRGRVFDLIFRPHIKFIKMYLIKRGYLDGTYGLIVSIIGSFYVFMKYLKLWQFSKERID
ncbi:glycosyltransferase [bacterium]|nr:glycosyltransferase [bacterium]NIN92429.1 glycosyltransferase [bacterium]NIO18543.1 glycosyltransferase [bacterium]NIO73539.1 glycosyltransferase [bacterium]